MVDLSDDGRHGHFVARGEAWPVVAHSDDAVVVHERMDAALSLQLGKRREAIAAVKAILTDELRVQMPPDAIELDAALFGTGLGLDSVDAIELVMCAEAKFGVSLPEDVLRGSLRSINTLVDLVFELQAKQAAP